MTASTLSVVAARESPKRSYCSDQVEAVLDDSVDPVRAFLAANWPAEEAVLGSVAAAAAAVAVLAAEMRIAESSRRNV